MGEEKVPKVSVVVASLNAAATLQRCIDSVARQRDVDIELLIVDGGSTDGTLQILESNGASITYWESEPDRGVYHAWNKALKDATGSWVCFLGADDELSEPSTLRTLVDAGERSGADLVCSRVRYRRAEKGGQPVIGQPWDWSKMTRFMCVAHPGLLHRRLLFDRFGEFSEQYRIAGDYEYLLRLGEGVAAAFVDEVTVNVGGRGLSSDAAGTLREVRQIQSLHPGIGPRKAVLNYAKNRGERTLWQALERLPFRLPENPATRAVGGFLGLHRHDYAPPEAAAPL
ncbi:MAG TPA: glycosyltransferase family 2 protein, partial [Actinomycetota bacterium]|nr:glycosyltransferase family 2 protein [Actinomycetota bacterium]